MSTNQLNQTEVRLNRIERSLWHWKIACNVGWAVLAICVFVGADAGSGTADEKLVVGHLRAKSISASSYNLVSDGKDFGGFYFGEQPNGNIYPMIELKNGGTTFFVEVVPDSTQLAISKDRSQMFTLQSLKEQTYFQLSPPSSPIGIKLLANKQSGGGVMLQDSNGKIRFIRVNK